MAADDTPPSSDVDEIMYDETNPDDEAVFEIIDFDDINELEMQQSGASADDSLATFSNHTGPVFCCALSSNGRLACSGGQDDKGYVWDPDTGNLLFECAEHKESVVSVAFNSDSSLVATGDLDGIVQIWDTTNSSCVYCYTSSSVAWMDWVPDRSDLVVGGSDGECWILNPGRSAEMLPSYGTEVNCGYIMPDGKNCIIGYKDGSIRTWNLEQKKVLKQLMGQPGHKDCVTSIAYRPDNSLILTSSVDGTAKLIKSSNYEVLWNISCVPEGDDSTVECADFVHGHPWVATGTNSGLFSIYDIPTKILRSSCEFDATIVKLICDPASPVVYTGDTDGFIKLFDARSGKEERRWSGHSGDVLDFVLSRQRDKIVSCSEDGECKVFKVAQS